MRWINQKYRELQDRSALALRLAARPHGVTSKEFARAAGISIETARSDMAELCASGALTATQAEARKVRSPGKPPLVFRRRREAA